MSVQMAPGDALIIVDVQNDFCPGWALPVTEGDRVVPVLNNWIVAAQKAAIPIYFSRDWHPQNHCSFREQGGPWPPHCVQNTKGAEFHPALIVSAEGTIISKASRPEKDNYSDFEESNLAEQLRKQNVRRVWIGGLALDYCVKATVLDALREGFETHVILPGTRAVNVNPDDGAKALEEMRVGGAHIEERVSP